MVVLPTWRSTGNVGVTVSGLPDMTFVSEKAPATITVINSGPDTANTIILTGTLSGPVGQAVVTPSQGQCSEWVNSIVTCNLGTLVANEVRLVAMEVTFTNAGLYAFSAVVASDNADSDQTDNQLSVRGVVEKACLPNVAPGRNYFTSPVITLSWSPVTWATGYELVLDDNQDFSSPIAPSGLLSADKLSITTSLPNGEYYWRVRALASGRIGSWSAIDQFAIRANQ